MTTYFSVTIRCDHGEGEDACCFRFDSAKSSKTAARREAKGHGWSSEYRGGRLVDLCLIHGSREVSEGERRKAMKAVASGKITEGRR